MENPSYPETLSPDWLPPRALAREADVDRLRAWILEQGSGGVVGLHGPPGSGTSTVARLAARSVAYHHTSPEGRSMRLFCVRTRLHGGPVGVASELLRS